MALTPREEFRRYCLYNLGFPVIEGLQLDDDQIEDRIDEAIAYYQEYHAEGTELGFYVYNDVTQTDIDNKYITIPSDVVSVSRIFNVQDSITSNNTLFDLRYQLRLNEMWDFTSASFLNYQLTLQHLKTLSMLFTGEILYTYQKYTHKLNIFWGWGMTECPIHSKIILEVYRKLNPSDYPDIYKDRWLRKYATALIRRQIGTNLSKFDEMPILGGLKISGWKILNSAENDIAQLEQEMQTSYSAPLLWSMG